MRKVRKVIVWFSVCSIIAFLFIIDYSTLGTKSNIGLYLGILVSICNILTSVLSDRAEKMAEKKRSSGGAA
jgi:hypothetical protein